MAEKQNELNASLIKAIHDADPNTIKKLIKKGADVNCRENGKPALLVASEYGFDKTVVRLVEGGADVNLPSEEDGQTPLLSACWNGYKELAGYLINNGADINDARKGGRTALMYAAHSAKVDLIRLLLEKGADINAENEKGLNALMYTDDSDKKRDAMEELIKQGADINHRNIKGKTVLLRAVGYGCIELVKLLLRYGADMNIVCNEGYDVMFYADAAETNSEEITALLESHGKKREPFCCGYRVQTSCSECGQPVIINGPWREIFCQACKSRIALDKEFWSDFFVYASDINEVSPVFADQTLKVECVRTAPTCSNCNSELDISKITADNNTPVICGKCNKKNSAFPAPGWLKEFTMHGRTPLQVLCAEQENPEDAHTGQETRRVLKKKQWFIYFA